MGQRYLLSYDMEGATPDESNKFRKFLQANGFKHLLASTYIYSSSFTNLDDLDDFLNDLVIEFANIIMECDCQFTRIRFAYAPCSGNKYKVIDVDGLFSLP